MLVESSAPRVLMPAAVFVCPSTVLWGMQVAKLQTSPANGKVWVLKTEFAD